MPIRLDISQLPLATVRWEGVCSDEEVSAYLTEMTALVKRPGRRALVYDAREAALPTATQRSLQGNWLKEHQLRIRANTVGTAFVIQSAIVRGGLTAVFWIQGLSSEHLVCATLGEALAWSGMRLEQAGLAVPNSSAQAR